MCIVYVSFLAIFEFSLFFITHKLEIVILDSFSSVFKFDIARNEHFSNCCLNLPKDSVR